MQNVEKNVLAVQFGKVDSQIYSLTFFSSESDKHLSGSASTEDYGSDLPGSVARI